MDNDKLIDRDALRAEFELAKHIFENDMLNGEVFQLADGRM